MRAQTATAAEEHSGVQDLKVDLPHDRVIVTFNPRKAHAPDLHDAVLKSGYKPAAIAD
jgi:copper chaperone CopZ